MNPVSVEIQRREAMGDTAQKNSGNTYCPYSLIFDTTTYVLSPGMIFRFSLPHKCNNQTFKGSMVGV